MPKPKRPVPYVERLRAELDAVRQGFLAVLGDSAILNTDLNQPGSDVVFVGFPLHGWADSTPDVTTRRMRILGQYRDWHKRLMLLFPHATADVGKRIATCDELIRTWLERKGGDHSVPATIEAAQKQAGAAFDGLRDVLDLTAGGSGIIRIVPDTNALMNNPDMASYVTAVGGGTCIVHLLPTVMREIDRLKDQGRAEDARPKAQAVARRLKGLRDKGSLVDGVALTKAVTVRAEHLDPDPATILDWLAADVADDRILAGALMIQSAHPGDTVVLVTSDMGLQTKADVARLPYVETPPNPESLRAKLTGAVEYRPSKEAPSGRVLIAVIRNIGTVTANELSFHVEPSSDDAPVKTTVGPKAVGSLAADESVILDLYGWFTEKVTVSASWTDASGPRRASWTVPLPGEYLADSTHDALVEQVRMQAAAIGKDIPESSHGHQPRVVHFFPSGAQAFYFDDLASYKAAVSRRDVDPGRAFAKSAPRPINEWSDDELRGWLTRNGA